MSIPPRGRPPTLTEKLHYQTEFPHLSHFSVTGEVDPSYDCVSLTVMPEAPERLRPSKALVALGGLAALDQFYREHRFTRVARVPSDPEVSCVAIFARDGALTHVALRDRHPAWWESKLGTGLRILHPLTGLEGGRYGGVVGYYSAAPRVQATPSPVARSSDSA